MAEVVDQQEIDRLAVGALARYDISPRATLDLINLSENWTYRVEDPDSGDAYALRVHRINYHTPQQIESELMWIDALRDNGVVASVVAQPARTGERVIQVATDTLPERSVVLFDWVDGAPPDPDANPVPGFRTLGAISAHMHQHARAWQPPAAFTRFTWDFDTSLGNRGHWGRWQDGLGMEGDTLALMQRTVDTIEQRLQAYGKGPDRFGLAHSDIRLANLLVDDDAVRVIDFDDCGFSWFMYDYATTVSFLEDHPLVPELRAAWLEGYRSVAEISAEDEAVLDTLVMLRRLLLVTWVGSHYAFAPEAQELGAGFTDATCALAEDYLAKHT